MMATLLSKVQLLRDLKALKMQAKVEEQKRQESLMQSNSKVCFSLMFFVVVPWDTFRVALFAYKTYHRSVTTPF